MQQMLIFFFFIYKYLHILAYLPEITGYAGAYLAYPVAPPLDGTLSLIYLSFFFYLDLQLNSASHFVRCASWSCLVPRLRMPWSLDQLPIETWSLRHGYLFPILHYNEVLRSRPPTTACAPPLLPGSGGRATLLCSRLWQRRRGAPAALRTPIGRCSPRQPTQRSARRELATREI
jgi:hypothetical protein